MGWIYQSYSQPMTLAQLHQAIGGLLRSEPGLGQKHVFIGDKIMTRLEERQDENIVDFIADTWE